MRFLSNFGCKTIFMCSVNFSYQLDSNLLFKESIGLVTSHLQVAYSFNLHEICPLLLTPCLDEILQQIPIYNLEKVLVFFHDKVN